MKKKKARKLSKQKTVPSVRATKQPATKVLGTVLTGYVQTQVPTKHAADVAQALAQIILRDYHSSFCPPTGHDDSE